MQNENISGQNESKVAIVTGASGNLGQAVVKKFIKEGYKVIGTIMSNDIASLDFPADKFEKVVVDLMNEDSSRKFAESIIEKYGYIDAAVLTVGGFAMGHIADTSTADIMQQYKLNFETAYNIARPCFVQMMKQNSGRIFIIGSRPGLQAWHGSGMVAYGLAKSLIVRLTELMNIEARGQNVVASVVVPGTIDTPQNRKAMPDADFSKWVRPEDIASVIYYHCTHEAAALRETVIKVYGNS
jgi:NAD(P)-dependent dehydrogenase (short-subunit alcohol dehydrogenase family)